MSVPRKASLALKIQSLGKEAVSAWQPCLALAPKGWHSASGVFRLSGELW